MFRLTRKIPKQKEVSKDLDTVISNLERVVENTDMLVRDIIEIDLRILQYLKNPEYGIHLADDIFLYIEEASMKARDEVESTLVKRHASLAIKTLIKMKHAFLLLAYKAREEEAKRVLEEGLRSFTGSMLSDLKALDISLPSTVTVKESLITAITTKSFLEKIVSFLWARREYTEKRRQFIWVIKKILEKIQRQHHLFAKTHDFAEAIRTATELLDKYSTEYLKEEETKFKEKFDFLKILFTILAILWILLLVIIYFFSWIPSTIFGLKWTTTTLSWLKANLLLSLSIAALLFLGPTILAKSVYFYKKFNLWIFKRKMFKLAKKTERL